MLGLEFGIWGIRLRARDLGFRLKGLGFRVLGLGCHVGTMGLQCAPLLLGSLHAHYIYQEKVLTPH